MGGEKRYSHNVEKLSNDIQTSLYLAKVTRVLYVLRVQGDRRTRVGNRRGLGDLGLFVEGRYFWNDIDQ